MSREKKERNERKKKGHRSGLVVVFEMNTCVRHVDQPMTVRHTAQQVVVRLVVRCWLYNMVTYFLEFNFYMLFLNH